MATTIAVRTRKSRRADGVAFSELSLRQNAAILEYCRTSMSALSGSTAGIMGLTGLLGFVFYFVSAFILSAFLTVKAGSRWNSFFITRRVLFINGLFGGLFVAAVMSFKIPMSSGFFKKGKEKKSLAPMVQTHHMHDQWTALVPQDTMSLRCRLVNSLCNHESITEHPN
ncbi:hypothetical protein BaRGS_00008244 [Batillaria attramentaria]|uniref:ER membrane protein complex subunit 6 n=1 Tax=Batillaria attramentaria TaxID=370345 RepID=A0ABD0LMK1_9CAEN